MKKNVNVSATKRDEVKSELIQFVTTELGNGQLIQEAAEAQAEIFALIDLIYPDDRKNVVVHSIGNMFLHINELAELIKRFEEESA